VKDNAAIVLTGNQPFTSMLINSNIDMFRYELIWHKKRANGFLDANRKPLAAHENILVFGKTRPVYYPIMRKGRLHKRNSDKKHCNIAPVYRKFNSVGVTMSDEYYPVSVLKFGHDPDMTVTRKQKPDKLKRHNTQKPVALFEYLIKTYTNENDTVLDNVIGSGTTAVACYNTGRRFIGIEKDKDIYEMAVERIKRDTAQLRLFA